MAPRNLGLAWLVLSCCLHVSAQYRIILERGDTIHAKEYYTKGDSLGFPGGRVAKMDILCMYSGKQLYQFPLPGLSLKQVKLAANDAVCLRGELYACKYAKAVNEDLLVFDPTIDSLDAERWDGCFRSRLIDMGVHPDFGVSPVERISSKDLVTASPPIIVLRTGDTLSTPRGVTWEGDRVRIIGGSDMPRSDVLMFVDMSGQHVFHERTGHKILMKPQVRDLSPCALGAIHARIHWDSVGATTEIPGITKELTDDPDFSECFYQQQVRAQRKKETMRTISTVIAVGRGATLGIQGATVPSAP
ncbi:MAG TPA: hypothetical protein PLL57_04510 [Flavobacteriales bacterium]|nr:hypothetical protein [Flavobacteriales bacterium]